MENFFYNIPTKVSFGKGAIDDLPASALLAGTMKPLNLPSNFENYFASQTVRFQV